MFYFYTFISCFAGYAQLDALVHEGSTTKNLKFLTMRKKNHKLLDKGETSRKQDKDSPYGTYDQQQDDNTQDVTVWQVTKIYTFVTYFMLSNTENMKWKTIVIVNKCTLNSRVLLYNLYHLVHSLIIITHSNYTRINY